MIYFQQKRENFVMRYLLITFIIIQSTTIVAQITSGKIEYEVTTTTTYDTEGFFNLGIDTTLVGELTDLLNRAAINPDSSINGGLPFNKRLLTIYFDEKFGVIEGDEKKIDDKFTFYDLKERQIVNLRKYESELGVWPEDSIKSETGLDFSKIRLVADTFRIKSILDHQKSTKITIDIDYFDRKEILGFKCFKVQLTEENFSYQNTEKPRVSSSIFYVTPTIILPSELFFHLPYPISEWCILEFNHRSNDEIATNEINYKAISIERRFDTSKLEIPKDYQELLDFDKRLKNQKRN